MSRGGSGDDQRVPAAQQEEALRRGGDPGAQFCPQGRGGAGEEETERARRFSMYRCSRRREL